jgi:hypothetical protein
VIEAHAQNARDIANAAYSEGQAAARTAEVEPLQAQLREAVEVLRELCGAFLALENANMATYDSGGDGDPAPFERAMTEAADNAYDLLSKHPTPHA